MTREQVERNLWVVLLEDARARAGWGGYERVMVMGPRAASRWPGFIAVTILVLVAWAMMKGMS